jgi:periplasmic protein TonB
MRLMSWLVCGFVMAFAFASVGAAHESAQSEKTVLPRVKHQVKAEYTKEAKDAGIQGTVGLSVEVLEDGTVGDVTVTRSLDRKYGLDTQAVKAVKQWTFEPGTVDGKPVRVRVDIDITFALI